MEKIIELTNSIDTTGVYEELAHPLSGGICVFIGAVRQITRNEEVTGLFFEAYESMALKQMNEIADLAGQKWPLNKVVIKHVVGGKGVKEPVVIVGASSGHRDASFEACRFLIDTLKAQVPIWKKESFKNKEEWVTPHP